jgi:uncharacterized delta-60 repeat protein
MSARTSASFPRPGAMVVRRACLVAVVLVVAVASTTPAWAAQGELDPTFGNGGVASFDFPSSSEAPFALAMQSDGRILVGGQYFPLLRLQSDGTLDPSFSKDGKVASPFGPEVIENILVQPDGRIVVGSNYGIARYLPDGSLDPSFGEGGTVTVNFGLSPEPQIAAVTLDPTGKIVVTAYGTSQTSGKTWAVARLTASGGLDPSFGNGGIVVHTFNGVRGCSNLRALAVSTSRIVIASGCGVVGEGGDFALMALNVTGALARNFGSGGTVTTDFGPVGSSPSIEIAQAVQITSKDKIVVAGSAGEQSAWGLARFKRSGTLDSGFGTEGTVISPHPYAITSLVLEQGSIDALGGAGDLVRFSYHGGVAEVFDAPAGGNALVVQPDGKLVAVAGRGQVAAFRYVP